MGSTVIRELLLELGGSVTFRLEDGPVYTKIIDLYVDELGDVSEEIDENTIDVMINLSTNETTNEIEISFSVKSFNSDFSSELTFVKLNSVEREYIKETLLHKINSEQCKPDENMNSVIIRKNDSNTVYDIHIAAHNLNVSKQWLKNIIPCSDYSYVEENGKKTIKEYYWDKDLVSRLTQIKNNVPDEADCQYVAQHCCEGDLEWARDLINSLKGLPKVVSENKNPQTQSLKSESNRATTMLQKNERPRSVRTALKKTINKGAAERSRLASGTPKISSDKLTAAAPAKAANAPTTTKTSTAKKR